MRKTIHTFILAQLIILILGCSQLFTQNYQNDSNRILDPFLSIQHINIYNVQHDHDLFVLSTPHAGNSATGMAHAIDTIEENEEEELFSINKKLSAANKFFISVFCTEDIGVTYSLTDLLVPFYEHFAYTLTEEVYLVQSVFRL